MDGRFRVVAEIGRGGMGAVYEAVNIRLRKRVALKLLKPELAVRKDATDRFLREARAASRINHPSVIEVHDFGELEDGRLYYVMEHLQGRDLADLVRELGTIPWARARAILLQVVQALGAAHDAGIIHRDIKPGNVFLVDPAAGGGADFVKVLDFGIAKTVGTDVEALTNSGDLLGTASYIAPEMIAGQPADARSDVYSTGILMYRVLTGKVPFGGTNFFKILQRHATEEPRPLSAHVPEIFPSIQDLVSVCLAKDPDDRFQSMAALEFALESIGPSGEWVDLPGRDPPPRESAHVGPGSPAGRGATVVLGEALLTHPPMARTQWLDATGSGRAGLTGEATAPTMHLDTPGMSRNLGSPRVRRSGEDVATRSGTAEDTRPGHVPALDTPIAPPPRRRTVVVAVATGVLAVVGAVGLGYLGLKRIGSTPAHVSPAESASRAPARAPEPPRPAGRKRRAAESTTATEVELEVEPVVRAPQEPPPRGVDAVAPVPDGAQPLVSPAPAPKPRRPRRAPRTRSGHERAAKIDPPESPPGPGQARAWDPGSPLPSGLQ